MNGIRHRLEIAYDGTDYAGWQVQPQRRTVQGELERVLATLCGVSAVRVEASGRTDAGVHAEGQVAHADLPDNVPEPRKLLRGVNALLEPDIRVRAVTVVAADFHARFSATGKEYRYVIHNASMASPFHRRYRTLVREPLDIELMREAAARLCGRHDFAAFSANPNREIDGTERTIRVLDVTQQEELITLCVRGDGFLYKMVRSIAGYLIRVGKGEVAPDTITPILASKTRTAHVPTAPPEGLFLWRVEYLHDRASSSPS